MDLFCLCAAFTERIIRKKICVTQLFPSSFQFMKSKVLNMQYAPSSYPFIPLLHTLMWCFIKCLFYVYIVLACSQPNEVTRVECIAPWWVVFASIENEYLLLFLNWQLNLWSNDTQSVHATSSIFWHFYCYDLKINCVWFCCLWEICLYASEKKIACADNLFCKVTRCMSTQ